MSSAATQIFQAVDALIAAIDGVESHEREPGGDPVKFPALQLFDDGDAPIESEVNNSRLRLGFTVVGFVEDKALTRAGLHDALLDLHAETVRALCADITLGGLAEKIETAGTRRTDNSALASQKRLAFSQNFAVEYAVPRGDPTTFA